MNDKRELEQLDKSELIDTIHLLEKRVNTLEKLVADLRQALGDKPPPTPKTSQNSSVPPSQDHKRKPARKAKQKRGPKAGHVGTRRQRVEPDEVIECRVEHCAACGAAMSDQPQHEVGRCQQVDIPPVQPVVREARRYRATCPDCETYQTAAYPPDFDPDQTFGPHLVSFVVYLHHAHPLSYERVQTILHDLLGLVISIGALVNIIKRSAKPL